MSLFGEATLKTQDDSLDEIHEIIQELKSDTSTNNKQDILRKYESNETLKQVIFYALNPYFQYYIKQIKGSKKLTEIKDMGVFETLDALRTRVITGDTARNQLISTLKNCSEKTREVMELIVKKDLKCGTNHRLVNKVYTDLIPGSPYMGAIAFDEKKLKKLFDKSMKDFGYVYSEEKYDGLFCNLIEGKTYSRKGLELFIDVFPNIKDFAITGEVLVEGFDRYEANGAVNSFKSLMNKISLGTDKPKDTTDFETRYECTIDEFKSKLILVAWDIVPLKDFKAEKSETHLIDRREVLKNKIKDTNIRLAENKELKSINELYAHFKEVVERGGEGTIVKYPGVIWENKKPNEQMKLKLEIDLDLEIIGLEKGNKDTKYENDINRVIVRPKGSDVIINVSGLKETDMEFFNKNKDNIIGKICTVTCSGLSYIDGEVTSLLHPRFEEVRFDKDEANTINECIEIEKAFFELERM